MGNVFECCFKTKTESDPLSIEEIYESLPNSNNEEFFRINGAFKRWYINGKKISWNTESKNQLHETYSNEEYDRTCTAPKII
jgi:hypothetical protein